MLSILSKEKECYFCQTTQNLQDHHIFYGTGKRPISEKYGFKVWLCAWHHTQSPLSVHLKPNRGNDLKLKMDCQKKYEENHTREEFIKLIGRSYL